MICEDITILPSLARDAAYFVGLYNSVFFF